MAFNIEQVAKTKAEQEALLVRSGYCHRTGFPKPIEVPYDVRPVVVKHPAVTPQYGSTKLNIKKRTLALNSSLY